MLAQTGMYDDEGRVLELDRRIADPDDNGDAVAAVAELLRAGLERRAWRGSDTQAPPALCRLRGGDLRIYRLLRDVDAHTGPGAYVCEGDENRPGCDLVFWSSRRSAKWCKRCRHNKRAVTRELRRPADRWDPFDAREFVGRICDCGEGFWALDTKQVHCSDRCRQAACRATDYRPA